MRSIHFPSLQSGSRTNALLALRALEVRARENREAAAVLTDVRQRVVPQSAEPRPGVAPRH